jgi:acylphosphatase
MFVVHGRVQGVGFRWFVKTEAARLGLSGWTRNTQSGTVEVLAEGEIKALDDLERSLQQGPSASRVSAVQVTQAPPADGPLPHPFRVL